MEQKYGSKYDWIRLGLLVLCVAAFVFNYYTVYGYNFSFIGRQGYMMASVIVSFAVLLYSFYRIKHPTKKEVD